MMKLSKRICRFIAVPMALITIMSGCAFAAPADRQKPCEDNGRRQEHMHQPGLSRAQPVQPQTRGRQPQPRVQPEPQPRLSHDYGRSNKNNTAEQIGLIAIGAVIGGLIAGAASK